MKATEQGVFCIGGGRPLHGTVRISAAKNAVLPVMAAALLADEPSRLSDIPDINDVAVFLNLLDSCGATISRGFNRAAIGFGQCDLSRLDEMLFKRIRYSLLLMGVAVARRQSAFFPFPGGCDLGGRPIDIHLDFFKTLGVRVDISPEGIVLHPEATRPTTARLRFPTVTGTQNAILASCLLEGTTVIENAAIEPEIIDMVDYLNSLGALITYAGARRFVVTGVKELKAGEYRCIPDRIEAMTYAIAAATTMGRVNLENVRVDHLFAPLLLLQRMGVGVEFSHGKLTVSGTEHLEPVSVRTEVYPGLATDVQPLLIPLLLRCRGESLVEETIYADRFGILPELAKMGARVERLEGRSVVSVRYTERLYGANVTAADIRAGAGLVIAALGAEGETRVGNAYQISRGYQGLVDNLRSLGAQIVMDKLVEA